jgi:hypothetical protein
MDSWIIIPTGIAAVLGFPDFRDFGRMLAGSAKRAFGHPPDRSEQRGSTR